jgi:hypothetical protein
MVLSRRIGRRSLSYQKSVLPLNYKSETGGPPQNQTALGGLQNRCIVTECLKAVMEPTGELEAPFRPYEGRSSPSMISRQYPSFAAPPLGRANVC